MRRNPVFLLGLERKTTVQIVDDLFAFLDRVMRQVPAELRAQGISINDTVGEMVAECMLVMYVPSMNSTYTDFYADAVSDTALITTLAIHRYEAAHGRLPGGD